MYYLLYIVRRPNIWLHIHLSRSWKSGRGLCKATNICLIFYFAISPFMYSICAFCEFYFRFGYFYLSVLVYAF